MECEIYNQVLGQKLTIKDYITETFATDGNPKGNYFLLKLDGLGEVQADRHTMDAHGDGSIYINSNLAERELQIELVILADESKNMEELRREISKIVNPKAGLLELRYKDEQKTYRINIASDHVPTFTTEDYLGKKRQRVTLTLVASDPFWYAENSEVHYLSNWQPNLEWELEFPLTENKDLGIELETFLKDGLVTLENDGDEFTGAIFLLSASGDVLNPEIIRIMPDGSNTQKMKLLTNMKAGDRIRISTISGQKRVGKWSDDRQKWLNIFNTLTMDSTFIQLDVGENYLRATAATHSDQLEIKVQYESRYVGV